MLENYLGAVGNAIDSLGFYACTLPYGFLWGVDAGLLFPNFSKEHPHLTALGCAAVNAAFIYTLFESVSNIECVSLRVDSLDSSIIAGGSGFAGSYIGAPAGRWIRENIGGKEVDPNEIHLSNNFMRWFRNLGRT